MGTQKLFFASFIGRGPAAAMTAAVGVLASRKISRKTSRIA